MDTMTKSAAPATIPNTEASVLSEAENTEKHVRFILENRTPDSLLEHPLFIQSIVLPTRPIKILIGALRRAVMLREPVCFSAPSGYGKSYALELAAKELKRLYPDIPFYRHVVNNTQVPSSRSFFEHFLLSVGISDLKGETPDLRIRLINRLIDAGRASRHKIVVFLIDETQGMSLQDFKFLKDIGNQLDLVHLRLVVVMMGQDPDFSMTLAALRNEGRLDLISRLTLRRIPFPGLSTEEDLRDLLEMIDKEVYPLGSGITWPQYFVPEAWAAGFRMVSQLSPLMAALCARLPGNSIECGVPARQLFLAFRRFMLDYADIEACGEKLPDNIWDLCVDYALIADAAAITAERNQHTEGSVTP